ncbi:MAG: hypothetical protein V4724_02875 [Pseudomonadota bacterium]
MERAEAETVLSQMAVSFDAQTLELETAQRTLEQYRSDLAACQRKAADCLSRLDACIAENRALDSQVTAAKTLVEELHGHVAELRRDLEQSNEKAARLQKNWTTRSK